MISISKINQLFYFNVKIIFLCYEQSSFEIKAILLIYKNFNFLY